MLLFVKFIHTLIEMFRGLQDHLYLCHQSQVRGSCDRSMVWQFAGRTQKAHQKWLYSQLWFKTEQGQRLKAAKGKGTWRRVQESPKHGTSSCLLPVELCILDFSQLQCVMIHTGQYQPDKLTQALVSRVFTGAQSHSHGWLVMPSTLVSRGQIHTTWPKDPSYKSHC